MEHLRTIIAVGTTLLVSGTYLYFRAEKVLDGIIEVQKRYKAGYYGHAAFLSKCPACGSRRSDIVWNSERKRLIRGCRRCGAIKPEQPRVPASAWDFVGRDIELIGDRKEDIREQLARANAPIMPKKDQKAETVN